MTGWKQLRQAKIREVLDSFASSTHRAGTLSESVLESITKHLPDRDIVSVETGCGKSTILFSNISGSHTTFCYDDRTLEGSSVNFVTANPYFRPEKTTFVFGPTQLTLPQHKFPTDTAFDLALIDGPHGYPFPDMEFWHIYPRLAAGALLVIDDIMIPSIGRMYDILREDRMFDEIGVFSTTGLLRRSREIVLPADGDHWWEQAYNFRRFPVSMKRYHIKRDVAFGERVDFPDESTADQVTLRGFDYRNGALITVDTSAVLRLRLPQTQGDIEVSMKLQMDNSEAAVGGTISVNGRWLASLPTDTDEHEIRATCASAPDGEYRIEITLPSAKSAHDRDGRFDFRRYGCALKALSAELRSDVANVADGASQNEVPIENRDNSVAEVIDQPHGNLQPIEPDKFRTLLRSLAQRANVEAAVMPRAKIVSPPPVLCPNADSLVRFLPLAGCGGWQIAPGLGPLIAGDRRWSFVDFAAFEKADFAYALCRSLLHRLPTNKQLQSVGPGTPEAHLLLLLQVDKKARGTGSPDQLIGLRGSRMLYRLLRTAKKLKLKALASTLTQILAFRARRLFSKNREVIVQRRIALAVLDRLS